MQILTPDEVESLQRLLVEATPEEREWLDKVLMQQARFEQENPWSCYRGDPVGYAYNILGVEYLGDDQIKILQSVHKPPYRLNVESCHKYGKSMILGVLVNYWFDSFDPGVCIVSSPKYESMVATIWGEVRRLRGAAHRKFPNMPMPFVGPRSPEMRTSESHFAVGLTADKGEAYSGKHFEYMLFIFDESEGLDSMYFTIVKTMHKAEGKMFWICACNPTGISSPVYLETRKTDMDGNPSWDLMNLSAFDHPNIKAELAGKPAPIPNALSLAQLRDWISDGCQVIDAEEKIETDIEFPPGTGRWWRPGPDAEARVLGRRPSAGSAAIWSEALFKACEEKELAFPLDKPPQIGCDIARIEGGDDCVTVGRWGGVALCCDEANGRPLPATAAKIKEMATWLADFANKRRMELIKKGARPFSPKQIPCVIDSGYAGMGVIDLADGYSFIACNAGSHANEDLKYPNKRSELWFLTAERAMLGHVSFKYLKENHPEFLKKLKVQLMSPKWSLDAADRRVVEKKDHTHQRLGRSPDLADAVNLCYYQVSLGSAEWVKDDEGELAESMAEKVGLNGRGAEDRAMREWEYGKRRGASSSVGLWGKRC